MEIREWTRVGEFVAICCRWIEEASIEVCVSPDDTKPSGKPDLSVVGVPGFPGLVPGSSAAVGFHDRPSLIMDGVWVN